MDGNLLNGGFPSLAVHRVNGRHFFCPGVKTRVFYGGGLKPEPRERLHPGYRTGTKYNWATAQINAYCYK